MPDLNEVEAEIFATSNNSVRRKHLNILTQHTGRNLIAYYSGWLSKPGLPDAGITDEDKTGFMAAVSGLDRTRGLDIILHTPGGDIAATQSIVDYLGKMFANDIRAIVPQIAMSAGTMVACSCKSIVMGAHSNLGPIDPHLSDIPAYGVREEINRAFREVKRDPSRALIWQMIIGQYHPTFLSQCDNAIRWSNSFVAEQLERVMFADEPDGQRKARNIVRHLSNYRGNRSHTRHIHLEECEEMGLRIERLEDDPGLQDAVLTLHHAYMLLFSGTDAFKVIENQNCRGVMKAQQGIG